MAKRKEMKNEFRERKKEKNFLMPSDHSSETGTQSDLLQVNWAMRLVNRNKEAMRYSDVIGLYRVIS